MVARQLVALLPGTRSEDVGLPGDHRAGTLVHHNVLTLGYAGAVFDMHADGVFLIDGDKFRELGFIATGIGTHGLYPSRDASKLYVANRGSHRVWLSGRFDNVVYAFDTTTGAVRSIPVGVEPHGLTVWPQPGRYSLGHTGNMR